MPLRGMHYGLPLTALLFVAAGCHSTLVIGDTGGSPSGDMAAADAGSPDAGVHDAGPPDFGEACVPERVDVSCTSSERVDPPFADEPFALRLAVGGPDECYCGESVECAVRRTPEGLALETALCSRGPLCDACFPYAEGLCELPALPPGRHAVSVNGEPGLVLDLAPRPMGSLAVLEACYGTAPVPEDPACPTSVIEPEFLIAPDEICVPESAPAGRVSFSVSASCETCTTEAGTCRVVRSGNDLVVTPMPLVGVCRVGCPDICFRREWTCTTPQLEPGVYNVVVGTTGLTTALVVGEDGPPGETCLNLPD